MGNLTIFAKLAIVHNGVISGKPFANQSTVTYTVYANNSGGSASATFDLTINEPTPNIDLQPR